MTDTEEIYQFKKNLKKLKKFQGTGTEMISVYIPSGSPIHETVNKLREELGQASNIKSKSTRTNVTGTLERIIQNFKIYKNTPKNGVAVFGGNVSDNPSKIEIELFTIEPPQRLEVGAYRCDSKFFLEPLQRMIETSDAYGLVVMDGREATVAIVKGTQVDVVKKMNSTAHAKHGAGGQSQRRFERLIEEQIELFYKRIGEAMDQFFLGKVKGVIVGGPGPAKEYFMKQKAFNYQLKILGVVDTGYTDEYGIREVLEKSKEILSEQEAIKEKAIINRFIKEAVNNGLAVYGEEKVRESIANNQASKVLLSEGFQYRKIIYSCSNCGKTTEKISKEKTEDKITCACGASARLSKEIEILEELIELAREHNMDVEIISTDTEEGVQFLNGFTGVGAFLRYKK